VAVARLLRIKAGLADAGRNPFGSEGNSHGALLDMLRRNINTIMSSEKLHLTP
jgi:hypothetical protein